MSFMSSLSLLYIKIYRIKKYKLSFQYTGPQYLSLNGQMSSGHIDNYMWICGLLFFDVRINE